MSDAITDSNGPFSTAMPICIGLVSVSDRASRGDYVDRGLPALRDWLMETLIGPFTLIERLIADEQALIEATLIDLVDQQACHLILTTGGTGPARRDVTPEATLAVGHQVLPGFGERMRQISLAFVPTAILSRQTAVVRWTSQDPNNGCLIVNLPGQPKAIRETLEDRSLPDGQTVCGIFSAIPYCLELIGGPTIHTHAHRCKSFRPASATPTR